MAAEGFRLREKKTWITQRKDQAIGWTKTTSTVELQAVFVKMQIFDHSRGSTNGLSGQTYTYHVRHGAKNCQKWSMDGPW